MKGWMTPEELAARMTLAGKPVTAHVIRYHCREPSGLLHAVAERVGRTWFIPQRDADRFEAQWQPYGFYGGRRTKGAHAERQTRS